MSLSGTLGFVPIDEVLRLLTRSGQESAVEVNGRGLFGRIFVGKRGIDLATTVKDTEIHRLLLNSGYLGEDVLRRITSGETTFAAVAGDTPEAVAVIREMTVESIYRISQGGEEFQVRESVTSPYASPKSFDLDEILRDADTREVEWEKIHEVIPDLRQTVTFNRYVEDRDEITVKSDDWKVLSVVGSGASVSEIGDQLGISDFWAASVTARLVKYDLLKVAEEAQAPEPERVTEPDDYVWASAEMPSFSDQTEDSEPAAESYETLESEPAAETHEIEESEELVGVSAEETEDRAEDRVEEHVDPNQSWWQEPSAADDDDEVEEDTEAFLEKVFSELESSESEPDEGHGLLRRRRMGTLRDFSSDS